MRRSWQGGKSSRITFEKSWSTSQGGQTLHRVHEMERCKDGADLTVKMTQMQHMVCTLDVCRGTTNQLSQHTIRLQEEYSFIFSKRIVIAATIDS